MMEVKNDYRCWDFPGGPVIKTMPSTAGGAGSTPGQGTKVLYASGYSQKLKKIIKNDSRCLPFEMGRAVERAGFGRGISRVQFWIGRL